MRRRQLLAATAVSAAAGAGFAAPNAVATTRGRAQPGQLVAWPEVRLLDGTGWGVADAQGKATVVVFWSVTCPFCQRHNAHVEKLRQQAAGMPLTILGVARDRNARAVRDKMTLHGWRFPVTLDDTALADALSARRMVPLTVTVDRRGRLQQVIPGEMFEADVLELLRLAA
jgi:hypothetical protein